MACGWDKKTNREQGRGMGMRNEVGVGLSPDPLFRSTFRIPIPCSSSVLGTNKLAALVLAVVLWPAPSAAADGLRDVETDHIDAYDDGGKPSFGVFANAGALLAGAFAARAELCLGDMAAVSLEGDYFATGTAPAYGASLGLPLFVERVRFRGLYIEPRLLGQVGSGVPLSHGTVGLGATAGWEETWRFGLSIKGGIGLSYETTLPDSSCPQPGGTGRCDTNFVAVGVRPLVDAAVGWVF
jgi:hypothetical protein